MSLKLFIDETTNWVSRDFIYPNGLSLISELIVQVSLMFKILKYSIWSDTLLGNFGVIFNKTK